VPTPAQPVHQGLPQKKNCATLDEHVCGMLSIGGLTIPEIDQLDLMATDEILDHQKKHGAAWRERRQRLVIGNSVEATISALIPRSHCHCTRARSTEQHIAQQDATSRKVAEFAVIDDQVITTNKGIPMVLPVEGADGLDQRG